MVLIVRCWRTFLRPRNLFILLGFVPAVILDNYPFIRENCKPCAKKMNTVVYQAPICTVKDGQFTDEGITACTNLNKECPEFNQNECQWMDVAALNATNKSVPCCRLKYKAKGDRASAYTWMEVYYTLQWNLPGQDVVSRVHINNIVEVHRFVNEQDAFGDRAQPDWPESVTNPSGERGLAFTPWSNPSPNLTQLPGLCAGATDDHCNVAIVDYLKGNFKEGFYPTNNVPNASTVEISNHANITIEYLPFCIDIILNENVSRACQVLYVRRSVYMNYTPQDISFPYLEVNVYQTGDTMRMRHAYYPPQDPEQKEEILNHCQARYQ